MTSISKNTYSITRIVMYFTAINCFTNVVCYHLTHSVHSFIVMYHLIMYNLISYEFESWKIDKQYSKEDNSNRQVLSLYTLYHFYLYNTIKMKMWHSTWISRIFVQMFANHDFCKQNNDGTMEHVFNRILTIFMT